ncbi:MAG TPA: serine hydrolase domain-containing protein, partial [Chitinophagaceae bacterium]
MRISRLLILCCISSSALFAQSEPTTLTEASPASVGMSADRLARIDQLVNDYVNKHFIAGATVLVARKGRIVYYKGIGYNDIDKKTPIKRDAICRIASQTKAITSVGVMMLWEEGKISLEDPVSKYIPEFKNPRVLDKFNP